MKTMTIKGRVYQDGKLYMTKNGSVGRFLCHVNETNGNNIRLHPLTHSSPTLFVDPDDIVEINPDDLGTITNAPVELFKGDWYMCEGYKNKRPLYFDGELLSTYFGSVGGIDPNNSEIKVLYRMGRV